MKRSEDSIRGSACRKCALVLFALAGCATSPYPPTVHYGVNVNYGSYWGYDRRDYHHHHYRPPPTTR